MLRHRGPSAVPIRICGWCHNQHHDVALFRVPRVPRSIAEQQLRLDALTKDLRMAEAHYNNLRQERAELLSPSRLREQAVMLGMYQGLSTKFKDVPADVVAQVMISTAKMNPLFADPAPGVASAGAVAQMRPVEVEQP
jgi:hypothetical protein